MLTFLDNLAIIFVVLSSDLVIGNAGIFTYNHYFVFLGAKVSFSCCTDLLHGFFMIIYISIFRPIFKGVCYLVFGIFGCSLLIVILVI